MIELLAQILIIISQTLTLILFVYVILSWVLPPFHPARQTLNRIVDPLLQPIRNLLPQTGMIDFSPIVLFILLQVFERLVREVFL